MIVGRDVRVRCDNKACARRGAVVSVPIPFVAPNVLGWPRLVCAVCSCDLFTVPEESAPDA